MAIDKSKVRLPSSGGGIMQYYDEYSSKMHIEPWQVIVLVAIVMIIVVLLNALNPFGL
jgi:preprotein translocase subunit Sec61beta